MSWLALVLIELTRRDEDFVGLLEFCWGHGDTADLLSPVSGRSVGLGLVTLIDLDILVS
jgi:hypothetical protein